MRLLGTVVFLGAVSCANAVGASTPLPIPPDPAKVEQAKSLLDAVGFRDCFTHPWLTKSLVSKAVDSLMITAKSRIEVVKNSDVESLLESKLDQRVRTALAQAEPELKVEKAGSLAYILSSKELEDARNYFTSSGGSKISRQIFCSVDENRLLQSLVSNVSPQIDSAIHDARNSVELMNRTNGAGPHQ